MRETTLSIERTPHIIATEINSIKRQTQVIMLQACIEIGRRLVEAKELVPHGEWSEWLEKTVDYSQRTASNFMRLYEEYGNSQASLFDFSNSQALAKLSYTQAVALLGIPSYEREQFIEEHDVESMSTRELQQAIKERDEAQRKLKEVEQNADQIAAERDELKEKADSAAKALAEAEKERKQFKADVDKLSKELKQARATGASPEQIKQLKTELADAQKKVKDLEEAASKPVTLEPAIIEKVPEDVERELNELRNKVKQFEEKAGQPEALLKFKVRFDTQVGGFKELLAILEEIKTVDPASYDKYRGAVSGLLDKMLESLRNE